MPEVIKFADAGDYDLTVTSSGGLGQYEWEHVASSTDSGLVDMFAIDVADSEGVSRAVERLTELSDEKSISQPEVSARLLEIANRLQSKNQTSISQSEVRLIFGQ